ncbi:hypothetical protein BJY00DRAFT_271844 [Aspergillus carlsbadensis]|nr:hypothetical protein BJY00DRAFT_271844 [Aspergillus carlsbadensis]
MKKVTSPKRRTTPNLILVRITISLTLPIPSHPTHSSPLAHFASYLTSHRANLASSQGRAGRKEMGSAWVRCLRGRAQAQAQAQAHTSCIR